MVSTASLLGPRHLGEVMENKPAIRLLCPWARHLTGRLRLYVEGRWPGLERDGLRQPSQPKICCMMNTTQTNWSSAAPQRKSPRDKYKKIQSLSELESRAFNEIWNLIPGHQKNLMTRRKITKRIENKFVT